MTDTVNKDYVDMNSPYAIMDISRLLLKHISSSIKPHQELIILCIGTDRSTGDSLGPLVGYKLNPYILSYEKVHLLGTLDQPVHAKNLQDTINKINYTHLDPFILAIDASLGSFNKIGHVSINKGPLRPGLGVNKKLPIIGDISITGVVNIGGMMEYMVLQNTRLSLVMNMAEIISQSINRALFILYNQSKRQKK